jgi:hypothetical protein
MASFSFEKISVYIKQGEITPDADYGGGAYTDTELRDIDVTALLTAHAPEAWVEDPTVSQICNTLGEDNVKFAIRRWARGDADRIEYWLAEPDVSGDYAPDYLCAIQQNGTYFAVGCVTGHPFVMTPTVCWGNTDGSADPPPLMFTTPEELIAASIAAAQGYVRDQCH